MTSKIINQLLKEAYYNQKYKREEINNFFMKSNSILKKEQLIKRLYIYTAIGITNRLKGELVGYLAMQNGIVVKYISDDSRNIQCETITYEEFTLHIDKIVNKNNEQITFI